MQPCSPLPAAAYEVTTDHARVDFERAAALLRGTFWAADMTAAALSDALRRSVAAAALYRPTGELVGFARAVGDGVTFAYLTDVIVDAAHRGHGLARALSEALLAHPALAGTPHWALLASHERVGLLYADLGFRRTSHQHAWMELFRRAPGASVPA